MTETLLHDGDIATVMIVDDVPANQDVIVGILQEQGHRVVVAQDGEEALQRAILVQPDLILLDIMMPVMDGYEVCRRLKAEPATLDIPVIFMTSLDGTEHKLAGFEAGAVDYVTKPLHYEEVVARVDTHLKMRLMQKRLKAQNAELVSYRMELELRVLARTAELSANNRLLRAEMAERKLADERLELMSFALNHVSEAVFLVDQQAHLRYVNDRACRELGYSRETLLGMTVADIDPEWPEARWLELWQDLTRRGAIRLETTHVRKNGTRFPVEVSANYFEYNGIGLSLAFARDVSEHKRLEKTLRVKEHYQRALLDNFPFMVWLKDTESRLLAGNQAYADIAGVASADDLIGKSDLDFFPHELAGKYREDDREVLDTGRSKVVEEFIADQSGGLRSFETYKAPVVVNGVLLGTVGFARDITEEKAAAALRHESEQRYREIFENVSDGLFLLEVTQDQRFRYLEINRTFETKLGVSRAGMIGKYVDYPDAPMSPESCQAMMVVNRRCLHTAAVVDEEIVLDVRGKHCVMHFTIIPMFGSGGPDRIIGIFRDITERKRMQDEIALREQEFRTLVENSPDAIARYDVDCRCVYVNRAYEALYGVRREAVMGDKWLHHWRMSMSTYDYMEVLLRIMTTGTEDTLICEMHDDSGARSYQAVRLVPEYGPHGKVINALAMARDISALKATERHLQESRLELRAMAVRREAAREEERKRIAREIHDELGQYLSVLRLKITTLDYRFGDDHPDLRTHALKATTIVDQAIAIVRTLATRLRPVALEAGIVPALEWLAGTFTENTGIRCELQLPEDNVAFDEDQGMVVFRVVQESLTNVLRHAEANAVKVSMTCDGDVCQVSVQDDGKGFDTETGGRRYSFGLSGMRERAALAGGALEIVSAPGNGTVLNLRVPFREDREVAKQ